MPVSRLVAHAPLGGLTPVFDAIRAQNDISETRPPEAIDEALAAAAIEDELPHVPGDRVDRTDLELVTIDPAGSKDLDQALAIEDAGRGWVVYYAIADVAAHVTPGGPIDRDAWTRAETVYCPDKRIGLHPEELSEGFASLLPGQRTKAALWTLTVDMRGELRHATVERAWVRSRHQYAYDELQHTPPREAKPLVEAMARFGSTRRAHLRERGGVTLPKPSQEVVGANGGLGLEFRAAVGVEDDNAQFSLLAGEAAARMMLEAGIGVLRTMPPAEQESLDRLRTQALALGVDWPAAASYADALDSLDVSSPQAAAFLTQATRLFRGARWEAFAVPTIPVPELVTHGALAAPYAHVTAPLRRLVDRYATEVCLAHSAGRDVPQWVLDALPHIGDAMTAGVRRASAVDRACIDAIEAAVLAPHLGEEFEAVGLDDRTIQLTDPAVVARCKGDVIPGKHQTVRLIEADAAKGPVFEVA